MAGHKKNKKKLEKALDEVFSLNLEKDPDEECDCNKKEQKKHQKDGRRSKYSNKEQGK